MGIWLVDDIALLMPSTMQRMMADSHYNEFLKEQRDMSNRDWLIEKKLVEAGGIGRKVYLHIGRGHGKTFTLMNHIAELEAKGHEVHIVDYRNSSPKLNRDDIERIKECVIDWDLMSNRDYGWRKSLYDMSFDWEIKWENERKKRQELCVIPWESLERDLFKRHYFGKWYYSEEEENGNDQDGEQADRNHNRRRAENDRRPISFV